MGQGAWTGRAALGLAALALFVALGGSVYAATRGRIEGSAVRVRSLPGNRLKLRSVPGNRLRPRSITAQGLAPGALGELLRAAPLTGAEIDEATLGQVPLATHAASADYATSAGDAQTALDAVNAIDAQTVNGHGVGCLPKTTPFAGACWQASAANALTAPQAAIECAKQGGTLPEALQLAAFALQPGVSLASGGEWSGDITIFSGLNAYAVATINPIGEVDASISTNLHEYRCVIPLVA